MKKQSLALVLMGLFVLGGKAHAITWVVDNTDGGTGVANSLGWCVQVANMSPGPDTIIFSIPGAGPHTIVPLQTYRISDPATTIDGFTEPGSAPNTNPAPMPLNTVLMVEVDGSGIQNGVAVFEIESNDNIIRGLNIHSGPAFEITIGYQNTGLSGNRIEGNFIGTDITGTASLPSGWLAFNPPYVVGVYLLRRAGANIVGSDLDGDSDELERNLISGESRPAPGSGMTGFGVLLDGNNGAVGQNVIAANLIGTNIDADTALPNNFGVGLLSAAPQNLVIGNVISGHLIDGVWAGVQPFGPIGGLVSDNEIYANFIGLDPNTDLPLPNGQDGIHFEGGCVDNFIGTTDWTFANVMSGNARHGVYITGSPNGMGSTGNRFVFNLVGMDTSGAMPVPNGENGFELFRPLGGNLIGEGVEGNLISGNTGFGVHLFGSGQNRVESNIIGRNLASDTAQPNGSDGIRLDCTDSSCSDNNQIEANLVADNGGDGIGLWGAHSLNQVGPDNIIQDNSFSGIYADGPDRANIAFVNQVLSNQWIGIELRGSSMEIASNTISGNARQGIALYVNFGSDASPATWGDDVLSMPIITGNDIDANLLGGIRSEDTEPTNGRALHLDNTIGDNGGIYDVWQGWYGAVEILDELLNPIVSGAYTATVTPTWPSPRMADTPDGGLWGRSGFSSTDVSTWFLFPEYSVNNNGNLADANPHTLDVIGPTAGSSTYSFDGTNNDTSMGGWPAGITTFGQFRYQVAEAVTYPDADGDGEPDITDCAPSDPDYQGSSGVPCDADGDGYCDAGISGVVQQGDCPNDICAGLFCTPTDCLDSDASVNPGATEQAFGDPVCDDGLDNDCDGDTDGADTGCWECTIDAECDDGDVCTGSESCVAGFCRAGTALDCDDGNVCTDDSCDASSGCSNPPNADPCDDGLFCTLNDTCAAGACTSGPPRDCSIAADQCNDGFCDEAAGQCARDPLPDGTSCDDGLACTVDDACAAGACSGTAPDADSDGHFDDACGGDDCDDSDASIYTGAPETCDDGIDQDCNGEDLQCQCPDDDGDGHHANTCGGTDCDDTNAAINPDADEICDDTVDNDCNGDVDGDDPACSGCVDADGDGHEDEACGGDDCDDTSGDIYPGAPETCDDGIDQDCNGADLACACEDTDGDGHEDEACGGTDCDDTDENINPDADEDCDDSVDNDCDGDVDGDDDDCQECADADGDTFPDEACGGADCDDADETVNPDASEVCDDGVDNDCDGLTDDGDEEDCERGKSSGCGCGTPAPVPAGLASGLLGLLALLRRRSTRRRK